MVHNRTTRVSAYSIRKIQTKHIQKANLKPKIKAELIKKKVINKSKPKANNEKKGAEKTKPKLKFIHKKQEINKKRRSASNSVENETDPKQHENKSLPDRRKHQKESPQAKRKRARESSPITQKAKKDKHAEADDTKSEISESDITDVRSTSASNGDNCLRWLLNPIKSETFFSTLWEKKPLLVRRHNPDYYNGIFSSNEFDRILRNKEIWYNKNIDVTTYSGGVRETHNPDGRAYSDVVWNFFQEGCSIRFLNPQTYSSNIWQLNSNLQEVFGSFVGANVYLTPSGSQGFAPHYDDIEAFVLQLEGRKQWKLYNPRTPEEKLPRYSSANFTQQEIGNPILTVVLEPGDMLYFPRGIIHQAKSLDDDHSLHITLSTFQRNTWGDYFAKLIPRALEIAIEEDVEFRKALPVGYLEYMGVSKIEVNRGDDRASFIKKTSDLTSKLIQYLPMDAAADQMAKDFLHESLPPWLTPHETTCSIHRSEETVFKTKPCWTPEKRIRIIRSSSVRLVMEETIKLYHSVENTRQYREIDLQYIVIEEEYVTAVEHLINTYPSYTAVEDLPLDTLKQKMTLATMLYERGLLVTEDTEVQYL